MTARTLYYAATLLISIHMANSYILLTANLEDVHAIAKQIAASPVVHQINKIIRRASNVFNQEMKKPKGNVQMRANDWEASNGQQENRPPSPENDENASFAESRRAARRQADDLAALGKNASYYLASINKILQNV